MNALSAERPEIIRKAFPGTWYYPKWQLVVWFPRGVLNDAFADQVVTFVEMEERLQDAAFNRYTDLSGLTEIRLKLPHFFHTATRRRRVSLPAKSAFLAPDAVSFSIACMYEMLMDKAKIDVCAFRDRKTAAAWLDVPMRILQPPK